MTRPDLGIGEPGQHPSPSTRRNRQALFWSVYVVVGIAQAWLFARALERFDISPAVIGGIAVHYVGLGYLAWRGSRGRLNESPLELGLARVPADGDPSR